MSGRNASSRRQALYILYTNEYTVGTECFDKIIISDKLITIEDMLYSHL